MRLRVFLSIFDPATSHTQRVVHAIDDDSLTNDLFRFGASVSVLGFALPKNQPVNGLLREGDIVDIVAFPNPAPQVTPLDNPSFSIPLQKQPEISETLPNTPPTSQSSPVIQQQQPATLTPTKNPRKRKRKPSQPKDPQPPTKNEKPESDPPAVKVKQFVTSKPILNPPLSLAANKKKQLEKLLHVKSNHVRFDEGESDSDKDDSSSESDEDSSSDDTSERSSSSSESSEDEEEENDYSNVKITSVNLFDPPNVRKAFRNQVDPRKSPMKQNRTSDPSTEKNNSSFEKNDSNELNRNLHTTVVDVGTYELYSGLPPPVNTKIGFKMLELSSTCTVEYSLYKFGTIVAIVPKGRSFWVKVELLTGLVGSDKIAQEQNVEVVEEFDGDEEMFEAKKSGLQKFIFEDEENTNDLETIVELDWTDFHDVILLRD
ncbi:hypothetical protein HK098_006720 [Nowakowskiella sp. JEL0407]|nr:hypothetical protein HK098_006720 [Nowakowskiella sp. JEL0407]